MYRPRSNIDMPPELFGWYHRLVTRKIPPDHRDKLVRREKAFVNRQQRLPDPVGAIRGKPDRAISPGE